MLIVVAIVAILAAGGGFAAAFLAFSGSSKKPHAAAATVASHESTHAARVVLSKPSSPSATPATSFAELYKRVSTGVLEVDNETCDGDEDTGTAFLLSPTLAATVEHVVDDASSLTLTTASGQDITGTVVGSDSAQDVALIKLATPTAGYDFTLSTKEPDVGDEVAAIGFPLGEAKSLSSGIVGSLDRTQDVEGTERSNLIETQAPVNPGNSGGPLLLLSGTVVGLVDATDQEAQNYSFAVSAPTAKAELDEWTSDPTPSTPCATGGTQIVVPAESLSDITATAASSLLSEYFNAINTQDVPTAYSLLTPEQQANFSLSKYEQGLSGTTDSNFHVTDAGPYDDGGVYVTLAFQGQQPASLGPDGLTCENWTLTYLLAPEGPDDSFLIAKASPGGIDDVGSDGVSGYAACGGTD